MTEALLQQSIVQHFKTMYSPLMIESSWNGINLSPMTQVQKAKIMLDFYGQGGIKGSSDLKVYLPDMKMLHIELKKPSIADGKGQSPSQVKVQKRLEAIGHKYYLVNSSEKFFKIINDNLSLEYRQELLENYSGEYTTEMVKKQYNLE